jgi:transposase
VKEITHMLITLVLWPPRRRPNRTGSRTAPKPFLSDSQWLLIADLLADPPPSPLGGRPRVAPRLCLEGIIWVLVSGARWQDLPERHPSPSTCWRRLREWSDDGRFLAAWQKLLGRLDRLQGINWEEAIGDGSFVRAKKGAPRLATAAKARAAQSC